MTPLQELAAQFNRLYDLDTVAAGKIVSDLTDDMIDDPRLYEYIEGGEEMLTDRGVAILRLKMSRAYGSGDVAADEARGAVRSAVGQIQEYQGQRDSAVRAALAADVTVKDLMADTGLSRSRIYQIRDNRR